MIAVEVNNLSKVYFKNIIRSMLFGIHKNGRNDFTALSDISFSVNRGETFSIIGLNGAGKSTLLQLLCGILIPTSGTVTVNGKISAILELGSGFDPNFTGLENIKLYYQMIGNEESYKKENIEKIIKFSELENFINNRISTYSSGMIARLAFAVRVFTDFDVLIVDEILSVGDVRFQKKCHDYFTTLKKSGKTIICVSHNTNQVLEISDTVCLLENSKMLYVGNPKTGVYEYMKRINMIDDGNANMPVNNNTKIFQKVNNIKTSESSFISIICNNSKGNTIFTRTNKKVSFQVSIKSNFNTSELYIGFNIRNLHGIKIGGKISKLFVDKNPKEYTLEYHCDLNRGEYFISFNLLHGFNSKYEFLDRSFDRFLLNVYSEKNSHENSGFLMIKSILY